jgi:hypothetical protein
VTAALSLAFLMMTGPVRAAPAQSGSAGPAPTVTVTTEPTLGQKLPATLTATWSQPRILLDTLHVEGKVLSRTTVVAVWTSQQQPIKRNQAIGGWYDFWTVTQAPVGAQSHQVISRRMTTARGTWGPWSDDPLRAPYADVYPSTVPEDEPGGAENIEWFSWYSGSSLRRAQVQYRLVLTLEPGTYVNHQDWSVEAP